MVPVTDLPALFAWAAANRLALFPIPKYCKRPTGIVRSHALDWSFDPGQWRKWYDENGGCNFGVSCGPSKRLVVDIDTFDGQPYELEYAHWLDPENPQPPTAHTVVRTPAGGLHLYFVVPDAVDSLQLRQPDVIPGKINVRAGRGYVVAPWSVTDSEADPGVKRGGPYRFLTQDPVTIHAPVKLLEHCSPNRVDAPAIVARDVALDEQGLPVNKTERWAVERRANTILARLAAAMPGELNTRLNEAAFAMGKIVAEGMMAPGLAEFWLWDAAAKAGIPAGEAKARSTLRSGMTSAARVGHAEPKSALAQLLAFDLPAGVFSRPPRRPDMKSGIPQEPVVSLLVYEGDVTLLSGGSGAGKTTFAASLAAASTTDVPDFNFGDVMDGTSDVAARTGVWIFVSYEGAQYIDRNIAAWYKGMGVTPSHPQRFISIAMDDGPMVATQKRETKVEERQLTTIKTAVEQAQADFPNLPITVVVDNVTSAVENPVEVEQAGFFMRTMKLIARMGVAVLVLGHPTKNGSSPLYGSHLLFSLADIVGRLEVLRQPNGEWTQWVEFDKHRTGVTHRALEIKSRRLLEPLLQLPPDWMPGNARERARAIEDLHLPYVKTIRVRYKSEKESSKSGVVESVAPKAEATVKL